SWFGRGRDCRPKRGRPASPPGGFSTLTTSAPSQASASVQDGPASNWVRSRTRTPARKAGNPPFVAIFSSSPQWHRLRPDVDVLTAVGVTQALTEALVHLNPTSLGRVCRAQSPAEVMRPDVGGEPVMAVIRHANRVRVVGPRNGDKHGAKDLLAR